MTWTGSRLRHSRTAPRPFTVDDASGNVASITNLAVGGTVSSSLTYTYNAQGEPLTSTDQSGNASHPYAYDLSGQLTQVNLPGGRTIRSTATMPDGNRTSVVDSSGTESATYAVNNLDQYTSISATTYTYDLRDGNIPIQFTPRPQLTRRALSLLPLLLTFPICCCWPPIIMLREGERERERESVCVCVCVMTPPTNASGATTYNYEPDGQLASSTGPAGTFTYSYNALSQLDDGYTINGIADQSPSRRRGQRDRGLR